MSTNICVPTSTTRCKGQTDVVSPEPGDRNYKMLLTTLEIDNSESNSDQTTHLVNNSIAAKREAGAAHNQTTVGGRVRKAQEKEWVWKAIEKKNSKEKRGQEEEGRLESEAEKARIMQAKEERKQQDALTAEEGQLGADDAVQTSPVNESQESGDDETSSPPSSPLLTARSIENLNEVAYPEGIKGPKAELNANVRDARFRYAVLPLSLRATHPSFPAGTTVTSFCSSCTSAN
jgi:hypothetical protein